MSLPVVSGSRQGLQGQQVRIRCQWTPQLWPLVARMFSDAMTVPWAHMGRCLLHGGLTLRLLLNALQAAMARPATFEEAFKKVDDLFTDTEQQEAVRTRLLTMLSEKAACLALEGSDAKVQARLKKLAGGFQCQQWWGAFLMAMQTLMHIYWQSKGLCAGRLGPKK